ncbi:hypothetical protein NEICINOT_03885 [Neisseria cinerea ATCC 14685]|uniref:Uncharacterized protein n=1 Tax=Neisseria cinerea ATCC 14685 TaxID=546262 RepID=D0W2K2_NEICI|nr:hypothetical protein NEICINOT_03885 [Neisseria cinerea ATCC 14685]
MGIGIWCSGMMEGQSVFPSRRGGNWFFLILIRYIMKCRPNRFQTAFSVREYAAL